MTIKANCNVGFYAKPGFAFFAKALLHSASGSYRVFFTGKKESIAHWHEIAQVHQIMMEKRWECKYGQESSYLRPAYYGPLSVMQEPSGGRRKPHQLGLSLRGVEKAAALRQCSP